MIAFRLMLPLPAGSRSRPCGAKKLLALPVVSDTSETVEDFRHPIFYDVMRRGLSLCGFGACEQLRAVIPLGNHPASCSAVIHNLEGAE